MRILEGLIEQVTNDTLFRQMGIRREKGSFVLGHATQSQQKASFLSYSHSSIQQSDPEL
jgi:hypothetical protein